MACARFLLAVALHYTLVYSTKAATDTLQGQIYLMDSVRQIQNYTSLTAGQSYVADFQVNGQPSNATIGNVLGFCVVLRNVGPSQCQYTIQLASGTIQVYAAISTVAHLLTCVEFSTRMILQITLLLGFRKEATRRYMHCAQHVHGQACMLCTLSKRIPICIDRLQS